ncbi:MAG: metal-sensitive transcriptional regulator [Patescibacteria group bacterium]
MFNNKTDKVRSQLNRVKGQLDGVIKMYDDERVCVDIVHQIMAVRSSLGRVARELLTGEAVRCSRERNTEQLNKILKEVFR